MNAPETPHAYMRHLITYITDNSTVAMHVNRNFGTNVKASRVAEVRAQIAPRRKERKLEPVAGIEDTIKARKKAAKGSDALLSAIVRAA